MTPALSDAPRPPALGPATARVANGAALRWTPGPDELRLPSCEDEPVSQNSRQFTVIHESAGSLRLHWRRRQDVYVAGDQFVYWHRQKPPAAPDVLVAFGVANRHRSSYVVWEEGKPPDFVLEVASPSSRQRDEKAKPNLYAKMGVPEYFWYDPEGKLEAALSGFQLRRGRYEELPQERLPDGVPGVRSKVLGLTLCIGPTGPEPLDISLCWYDHTADEFLPARHELAAGKRLAEARAAESQATAKRALATAERAEARAEQEAAARAAAEARVAELEAALRRSG